MDDNIWEYPFGDLDEDDDEFFRRPGCGERLPRRPEMLRAPGSLVLL